MKFALFLLGAAIFSSADVAAQMPSVNTSSRSATQMDQATGVKPACDYDTCALRLKATVGAWEIVKGLDGEKVASLGIRPPDLASLVADVPEAAAQARVAQRRYARSSALMWGGALVSIVGFFFEFGSDMHVPGSIAGAMGIGSLLLGGYEHPKNIDLLSKSIWIYNRALRR